MRQERAAQRIQADIRAHAQMMVYKKAYYSVSSAQKLYRGRAVRAITKQIDIAANLLKAGNIFLKFSKDGPPHDRLVWMDDSMRAILWCNPAKNRTHDLKPEARMSFDEVR